MEDGPCTMDDVQWMMDDEQCAIDYVNCTMALGKSINISI